MCWPSGETAGAPSDACLAKSASGTTVTTGNDAGLGSSADTIGPRPIAPIVAIRKPHPRLLIAVSEEVERQLCNIASRRDIAVPCGDVIGSHLSRPVFETRRRRAAARWPPVGFFQRSGREAFAVDAVRAGRFVRDRRCVR